MDTLPLLAAAVKDGGQANAWFQLFFVTIVVLLAALPLATIVRARFSIPAKVAAAAEERPFFSVLLGAANILLVALVGAAAEGVPALGVVGGLLFLALAVATLFGLTAVSVSLGRRLFRDEARGESVGAFVLAWLLLAGLPLLPWVGFLILLWFAARGIGAVLLSLYRRPEKEATSA
ncbi:MAG: hypothetical protein ACYS99_07875 [Planctomycetota bacterium]